MTRVPSLIVMIAALAIAVGCIELAQEPKASEPIKYGPQTGPPPEAPTLDYEAMAGLDPQTQKTNRERERHNDLEWRVQKLEDEVRSLNQIVRGIREVRIGESGPTAPPAEESND